MDHMDRLDELEAQSIFVFREAFARLRKPALLWSLGKDSNMMIWLARKAFFGRLPFPAMHVDTGKKLRGRWAAARRAAGEDRTEEKSFGTFPQVPSLKSSPPHAVGPACDRVSVR